MTDFEVEPDSVEETTDTHSSSFISSGVYSNAERAEDLGMTLHTLKGDSSDDVDPRKLNTDPTLSELRWYSRRGIGKTLVQKPILDSFKNGFEFEGDQSDEARELIEDVKYGKNEGYIDALIAAKIKERRDGFALIFIGTDDTSDGTHISPVGSDVTVEEITHVKVLTIDDLTESAHSSTHEQIKAGTGLDKGQYEIRQTGMVVNTDIQSSDFDTPVGYILDAPSPQFIHADRVQHFTSNPYVDGDYEHGRGIARFGDDDRSLGKWEGDSILIPSYNLLKGLSKGNWAIMQAIFRNAAHMYSVKLPPDADEVEMDFALQETRNINAKSSLIFPSTEYEVEQHESGSALEPAEYFDVIFNQVCAVHEMTKSVLFGTQTGTVSGSETDIKNYFNKVERLRGGELSDNITEYLTIAKKMKDSRTSSDFEFEIEIDWGPLFKVDDQTRIQMWQTATQAMTSAIGQYVLTPDEARGILSAQFTELDLNSLTEEQKDELDRIRLAASGQGPHAVMSEEEYTEGPENSRTGGQSGGRPQGSRQQSEQSGTTPNE